MCQTTASSVLQPQHICSVMVETLNLFLLIQICFSDHWQKCEICEPLESSSVMKALRNPSNQIIIYKFMNNISSTSNFLHSSYGTALTICLSTIPKLWELSSSDTSVSLRRERVHMWERQTERKLEKDVVVRRAVGRQWVRRSLQLWEKLVKSETKGGAVISHKAEWDLTSGLWEVWSICSSAPWSLGSSSSCWCWFPPAGRLHTGRWWTS